MIAPMLRAAVVLAAVLTLGGCGYTALKAPCSPDDGVPPGYDTTPLAYIDTPRPASAEPFRAAAPFGSALAGTDSCGPMKPI